MLQTDLNVKRERSRKISELEQELAGKNATPLRKNELEKALLELQEGKAVVSIEVHEAEGLFVDTRRLSAINTKYISECIAG